MTLDRKASELDDFFVTSEEFRLFDQLISADLDLPTSAPNAHLEQEEYYENECLSHSSTECSEEVGSALFSEIDEIKGNEHLNSKNARPSLEKIELAECNAEMELFPEVSENKENVPPHNSPLSELKKENGSLENFHSSWNENETVKSTKVSPFSVKSESDEGSDASCNPWICRTCKRTFRHQCSLNRHLPTHTDERNFRCETCGKAFRQMSTLSQHRAIHSNVRPYICPVCSKTFNRISTLISHKKTHSHDKPHKCNLCGKAFHQKGNLRNHIFTHTNERPYKCNVCKKGFNQMSNLVCHRTHYHGSDSSYHCRRCMKSFEERTSLLFHEKFVHGIHFRPETFSKYRRIKQERSTSEFEDNSGMELTIDAIQTRRMEEMLRRELIPFALLKTCSGHFFPVKLVPALEEKLLVLSATDHEMAQHSQCGPYNVHIKLPVVAIITQTFDEAGRLQLKVEPIVDENPDLINTETDAQEGEDIRFLSLN